MKIICGVLFSGIFIYVLMFLDTNPLVEKVEQHMLGEIHIDPEIEKRMINDINIMTPDNPQFIYNQPDVWLYDYNFYFKEKYFYSGAEKDKIKLKLRRNFVLHNFKDGIIWFTYALEYYDKNGEPGYGVVSSLTMKIHKEKGEWKVMAIDEPL